MKPYRKIRRKLTEAEAREQLARCYQQRQACTETLLSASIGTIPRIALCATSLAEIIAENAEAVVWLDKRIEDLQRFLPEKVPIYEII